MMNQELFENWLRCHCSGYVSLGKPKEESGLVYIPLLSPAPKRNQKLPLMPSFSLEEIESFHSRYQKETKDCSTESDKRYRLWMKMYHPHLEASEDGPSSFQDSFIHTPVKKGQQRATVAVYYPAYATVSFSSNFSVFPYAKDKLSCAYQCRKH